MLRQVSENHQRNWSFLDLKSLTLIIASWRMVQGIYIILEGMTLLHISDKKLPPIVFGVSKMPPEGGELFPNLDAVGGGYVVAGFVEMIINMGLLINTGASEPMPSWTVSSIVFSAFYTYLLVYQIAEYELHKNVASPFTEFTLFVLPLFGEVLHWVGIYFVRCLQKDMKYNKEKYREIPMKPVYELVYEEHSE